jgi:hypothetical protein
VNVLPAESGKTMAQVGVTADAKGVAVCRQILPGRYRLRIKAMDGSQADLWVTLPEEGTSVDVQLR